MSALAAAVGPAEGRPGASARAALVLMGTGVVGGAFLKLLNTPVAAGLRLVGVANSRYQQTRSGALAEPRIREHLEHGGDARDNATLLAALERSEAATRVIVDATASPQLAARHAEWLARGFHVVTANKAANGSSLVSWRALETGRQEGGTHYGDAATVGAGLPVIATVRRLYACGDALLGLEGVFSGSLGWLFNTFDGSEPFSVLLRRARELGYSEPDPRMDLSGQDVARKLLILARSAGFALGSDEVTVESLVPDALRGLAPDAFLAAAEALDPPLAERLRQARANGRVLRHLARLDRHGQARVGLAEVPPEHPAASLHGTDNQFALTTARYHTQPLVIQGPGAGAEVTAQALLGDILGVA